MKKLKRITGIFIIVGILSAIYIWFFVYNKPHRNFEIAKPDLIISAKQCYDDLSNNKISAGGKILEIYGVPSGVEDADSMIVIYFTYKKGMFGDEGIRCTMLPKFQQAARSLSFTDTVYIKGFCSGYNGTDVIMENCSLIHKSKIK